MLFIFLFKNSVQVGASALCTDGCVHHRHKVSNLWTGHFGHMSCSLERASVLDVICGRIDGRDQACLVLDSFFLILEIVVRWC